jgi:hypothetical protein
MKRDSRFFLFFFKYLLLRLKLFFSTKYNYWNDEMYYNVK